MVKRNTSQRSNRSSKLSKKDSLKSTGSSRGSKRKESFKSSKRDSSRSPDKKATKKKSTVSFDVSPRVEKIQNPKKRSIHRNSERSDEEEAPLPSHNDSRTSYIPFEEDSLPELSQAVIQKKMGKMMHLLDTRPMNYVCVTDRRNR